MELDKLTIGEAKQIASLIGGVAGVSPKRNHGPAIVVLDRGFVYVGEVSTDSEFCEINNAKNIRYWGTKNGLGQLVLEGPTKETKLDLIGQVKANMKAVISICPLAESTWKKF